MAVCRDVLERYGDAPRVSGAAVTDLFISYKSEDRDRVARLVAALEADGVRVWWDAHLGGGDAWRDTIEEELNAARCVIVVWSNLSTGREGSFVRDEASRAVRRGVYLPVRIDAVDPPLGFGETQALPMIGWKGDRSDPRYAAVLSAARAVIAGTARPAHRSTAEMPARGLDRRLAIGGGAALAAAAVGAGGWWALHRGPGAPQDSVAVLPFENLSGDPAQAYFSDGVAEELRSALTRIARLKVAARSSSELVRADPAPTAAAKLGVANIVTGSVQRGAETIRVTAELIDGTSGLSRWSQSYGRATGDALAIEVEIAESVADALSIALGRAEKALLALGGTTNPVAHDAYLRGQALIAQQKGDEALKEYDSAIAVDPNYALARAERVHAIVNIAGATLGGAALRAKLTEAEAEARRAVALAPRLVAPLSILGYVLEVRLDLRGAADAYAAAYKAGPGDAAVLRAYAQFLAMIGRGAEAVPMAQRAISLDPLRPSNFGFLGRVLLYASRTDEAIATLRQGVARLPHDAFARVNLGTALITRSDFAGAMTAVAALDADDYNRLLIEGAATSRLGDRAASDRALAALVKLHGDNSQYQIAEVHAQRGEPDLAFAAIARAWELADPGLEVLKTDPLLAPLRVDPRFATWLAKIGFP